MSGELLDKSLIPVAAELVGVLRDYGPDDVRAVLGRVNGRHDELAVVLAAMVDPDKTPKELLAWQTKGPVESRDKLPRRKPGKRALPREHGTERGYYQHRNRRDWPACRPCLEAHAEVALRRERANAERRANEGREAS